MQKHIFCLSTWMEENKSYVQVSQIIFKKIHKNIAQIIFQVSQFSYSSYPENQ